MNKNQYNFADQVAVVTGGCNGFGAAVSDRLVSSGARVAIWDADISSPEDRIRNLDQNAVELVQVDVSDQSSVNQAFKQTIDRFKKVDILVNSAGIAGPIHTVEEYPAEQWRKVLSINVDGTFHCCQAVVPGMREQNYGRIINIASVAGKEGNPNASAYSASKAAVIALTKSLGKELADYNIGVNCVTPAAAKTRIFDQISQEHIDFMLSKIPRGRFVTVDEVANMICWMASAENSFTTGAAFDLSGGRATY